jgi:site-specific recombinase XerD
MMNQAFNATQAYPIDSQQFGVLVQESQKALSPDTLRAYRIDAESFTRQCRGNRHQPNPASPDTAAAFLEHDQELSVASICRRMTTISRKHRIADDLIPIAIIELSTVT